MVALLIIIASIFYCLNKTVDDAPELDIEGGMTANHFVNEADVNPKNSTLHTPHSTYSTPSAYKDEWLGEDASVDTTATSVVALTPDNAYTEMMKLRKKKSN